MNENPYSPTEIDGQSPRTPRRGFRPLAWSAAAVLGFWAMLLFAIWQFGIAELEDGDIVVQTSPMSFLFMDVGAAAILLAVLVAGSLFLVLTMVFLSQLSRR